MRRIKKFSDFSDLEFLSESRVYFLNDLTRNLKELIWGGNEWADKLIAAQTKDIDSDTTFLTLDGDNFSFSKESDIKSNLDPDTYRLLFVDKVDDREPQRVGNYIGSFTQNKISTLANRGRVKIGRVIKKMLPEIPDKDLEVLVNSLKSFSERNSEYKIKLVKGKEIEQYYKRESCDPTEIRFGTLNNSCMMDKVSEKPYIFDIYTKNPESCQLAVMLNKNGQLVARALIWKIDSIFRNGYGSSDRIEKEEEFYSPLNLKWERFKEEEFSNELLKAKPDNLFIMDRVYYTKDWMENSFNKWAIENGFMVKFGHSIGYKGRTTDAISIPILNVKVNKIAYRQFPYLDTFKQYDVKDGILSNRVYGRGFDLTSTTGGFFAKGTKFQKKVDKTTNYIRRFKDLF